MFNRMRLYYLNKIQLSAFFIILPMVPLSYRFNINLQAGILWPAAGFTFALMFKYGKSILFGIAAGIFTGYLLALFAFYGVTGLRLFSLALTLTAGSVFSAFIGVSFLRRFGGVSFSKIAGLPFYIVAAALSAGFSGLFGILGFVVHGDIVIGVFFQELQTWFLGDLFGIVIFGLPTMMAIFYDHYVLRSRAFIQELVYYAILTLFLMLFFGDFFTFFSYDAHKFIFFPFVLFTALKLPYRSFSLSAVLFLFFMSVFPPFLSRTSYRFLLFDVNLFLTVMLVFYLSLKYVFHHHDRERRTLAFKQSRLNKLMDSMSSLFSLSTETSSISTIEGDRHAKKVFRLIFDMVYEFDYGSCMIKRGDKYHYIDAIGYDISALNQVNFKASSYITNLKKPLHLKHMEQRIKTDLGPDYDRYKKNFPTIKESVFMSVRLSEDIECELSFDIAKGSGKEKSVHSLNYFESINTLINSFYESHMMALEHDELKDSMIQALLRTIELYDPDIYSHSEDVATITRALAKVFGFDTATTTELYWAGIVHDIGKIGISPDIIRKKGVLTVLEHENIQAHATLGAELLKRAESLIPIASLVRHHHEHYDGNGYPDRLKAGENRFEAYLLGAAEAVATMARKQPYAPQRTKTEIIRELNREKRKQFHPAVVEKLIGLIDEGLIDDFYR